MVRGIGNIGRIYSFELLLLDGAEKGPIVSTSKPSTLLCQYGRAEAVPMQGYFDISAAYNGNLIVVTNILDPMYRPASVGAHLELGVAQVGLDLSHIAKLLLSVLGRDGGRNNDILANGPVDGGSNALLVCCLQSVNHTQDLGGVTTSGSRVEHCQTDLLRGIDDENRTDGERNALLGDVVQVALIDHVVEEGDLALGIGNDGELNGGRCDLVDILNPVAVRAEIVRALYIINEYGTMIQLRGLPTRPIIFTPLLSNSPFSLAKAPSSVVHTGVKSAG